MNRLVGMSAALVVATSLVTGCGGGGSSPLAITYNALVGYQNLLSAAQSFNLTGTAVNGDPLTLAWTLTPIVSNPNSVPFPLDLTISAQQVDSHVVITNNATSAVVADGTSQRYLTNALVSLGTARSDGSCTESSATPLPTAAAVGQTGNLGPSNIYGTCVLDAGDIVGTITGTWTVETINTITYFCSNTAQKNNAGAVQSTEKVCIEFTPAGAVGTHVQLTVAVSGAQVVFSN